MMTMTAEASVELKINFPHVDIDVSSYIIQFWSLVSKLMQDIIMASHSYRLFFFVCF